MDIVPQTGAVEPRGVIEEATRELSSIIDVPTEVRRISHRSARGLWTSNTTLAAAVMVAAAVLAVIVANLPIASAIEGFLGTPLTVAVGPWSLSLTIEAFVNDFLMAIFFLLVGVELKYEVTIGQLRKPRQAALPMLAACGGVAVPALIYLLVNRGGATSGWAIPIATDIAFALGVASLLGDRMAAEAKVFFQTLAIADDILAIVVLALFYGQELQVGWCVAAAVVVALMAGMNLRGVFTVRWYLLAGLLLWLCMYFSGIHATLSGVIVAFMLPARSDVRLGSLGDWLAARTGELGESYDEQTHILGQGGFTDAAAYTERILHHVSPPLVRVGRDISVPVNFLILPVFAFVNARISLAGFSLPALIADPVSLGVFAGAVLGKPIGIIGSTALMVRVGLAPLPKHVSWSQIVCVGLLGGVGFTMSILISGLAFSDASEVNAAKCAILLGAVAASMLGLGFGALVSRRRGTDAAR